MKNIVAALLVLVMVSSAMAGINPAAKYPIPGWEKTDAKSLVPHGPYWVDPASGTVLKQ